MVYFDLGMRTTLYLSKSSEISKDVTIDGNYVRLLKPFQIEGIRFLYRRFLKGGGVILNDEGGLGKTVQTVLFLSSIRSTSAYKTLILCHEDTINHWLFHFYKWSNEKPVLYDEGYYENVVLCCVLTRFHDKTRRWRKGTKEKSQEKNYPNHRHMNINRPALSDKSVLFPPPHTGSIGTGWDRVWLRVNLKNVISSFFCEPASSTHRCILRNNTAKIVACVLKTCKNRSEKENKPNCRITFHRKALFYFIISLFRSHNMVVFVTHTITRDTWRVLVAVLWDVSQASFVVASLKQYEVLASRKWDIIVVDNLDPLIALKHLSAAKPTFKLWITSVNLQADKKKLYKSLDWVSGNRVGNQKDFETTFSSDNNGDLSDLWKIWQCLQVMCRRWLLRRTAASVASQLPIRTDDYEKSFAEWIEKLHDTELSLSKKVTNNQVLVLKQEPTVVCSGKLNSSITSVLQPAVTEKNPPEDELSPSILDFIPAVPADKDECFKRKGKDDTGLKIKRSKPVSNSLDTVSVKIETDNASNSMDISGPAQSQNDAKFYLLDSFFSDSNVNMRKHTEVVDIKQETCEIGAPFDQNKFLEHSLEDHSTNVQEKIKFQLLDDFFFQPRNIRK